MALLGCGEDPVRQAALRDLQEQKELVGQRDRVIEAREREIKRLKGQLDDAEAERLGMQRALANAIRSMEDLARARALAEARGAQFRQLATQLRGMTEAGKLKVEVRQNRMIVSVVDRTLFDPGKAQLKKDGAETLREVTGVLKELVGRDFQVAGHTDEAPSRSTRLRSSWDLSTARAVEVVNFMVANGLPANRLSAAGYADQAPVRSSDTVEGRAENRRIEITLMPNVDDLPEIADEAEAPVGDGSPSTGAAAPRRCAEPESELPGAPAPDPSGRPLRSAGGD